MNQDLFLTPAEIRMLTGYKLPGKQAEWLRKNGVRHWIPATGRPVVPRSAIDGSGQSGKDDGGLELGEVA